jgi:hypothetical protein
MGNKAVYRVVMDLDVDELIELEMILVSRIMEYDNTGMQQKSDWAMSILNKFHSGEPHDRIDK